MHLIKIFQNLNLIDSEERNKDRINFLTMKIIDEIAIENNTTAYNVDKLFWLIGSGKFYLSKDNKFGNRINEFISFIESTTHNNAHKKLLNSN